MIEFVANRKLFSGENTLAEIPGLLNWYGKKKCFLVVYSNEAACVEEIKKLLQASGKEFVTYSAIAVEPDTDVIDKGAALCVEQRCDSVIAVGGGSVIDGAKTIAMLATNGGCTEDYQLGRSEVTKEPLTFIAVPTTAGTGAEATKVSVVYNNEKGFKKALYHTSMIAQAVILDPTVTVGLPPKITAATGMDAITHAIESYVSVFANPVSRMYSLYALKLLAENIVDAYREPQNLRARENMLLGSYFAGCAISVGTCLAHIVGQPVGAVYKIPHGDACSIFLLPSMELNLTYALPHYVEIAKVLGISGEGKDDTAIAVAGIERLRALCAQISAPTKLTQYMPADALNMDYILDNIQVSMGHIKTNPRPVSRELFKQLIEMAL